MFLSGSRYPVTKNMYLISKPRLSILVINHFSLIKGFKVMKIIYKALIITGGAAVLTYLSACTSGSNNSGGANIVTHPVNATIGQMSVIPLTGLILNNNKETVKSELTTTGSYKLAITNNKALPMYIDSIGVTGVGASNQNISNGSCGNLVQGNNSCYLSITPPDHAGSFVVIVHYHYNDGSPAGKLSQLIQYGPVSENNGYYYQNNNERVVTAIDQTRILSFPIILAQDYTNLTTTSNFNSSIDCSGSSYTKGTACTLTVATKGGTTNNIATVSLRGDLPNGEHNQLTLNTIISVNPDSNLIVGGTGLIINPANGNVANQVEVMLINDGTADATGLTITPTAPLTVSTNNVDEPCGSTLVANDICNFWVNAESSISGQNSVTITDNQGDSQLVNVFYIAESASAALTITPSGSLMNTIAGYESQSISLTLTNNSSAATTLTNLQLTNITAQNNYMTYVPYTGGGSACRSSADPSGVTSLSAGASCGVTINYNPALSANAQSGNIVFNPIFSYTDNNNITKTYSQATLNINYSSTTPVVSIVMNTPASNSQNNPFAFHILPNGSDFESQVFTFTNTGNIPASAISFNNVLSGYPSLNSVNVTASSNVANPCVNAAMLAPGASCSTVLTFGPVAAAQDLESIGLSFSATNPVTSATTGIDYYITTQATDTKLSLATIAYSTDGSNWTSIESTSSLGGTSGNPLTFTNYQAYPVYLKYTYSNNGTESALNFNVNLNNIPATYSVVSGQTTCSYGATVATLAIGASCNVVLKTVDYTKSAIYANGAAYISGSLNINVPALSYTSPNTGVHKNLTLSYAPTSDTMTYVTTNLFFSNTWNIGVLGNGESSLPWWVSIRPASYSLASGESNPLVNLNIASWGPAFESYSSAGTGSVIINPNSWNIPQAGTTRSLNIEVPNYMPATTYTFPYTVTSGYDPTTSYSSTLSFTLN